MLQQSPKSFISAKPEGHAPARGEKNDRGLVLRETDSGFPNHAQQSCWLSEKQIALQPVVLCGLGLYGVFSPGDPIWVDLQMPEAEVLVVASCPEDHHDRVMNICKGSGMFKAFGKAGDFIDALNSGAKWFDLWKAKVCQTVLAGTMHSECSVVRILCIQGGPNSGKGCQG
eukprot:s995_g36.t1